MPRGDFERREEGVVRLAAGGPQAFERFRMDVLRNREAGDFRVCNRGKVLM